MWEVGSHGQTGLRKERLDRGFQNIQWRNRFPYSRVITLMPSESDHCPILIEAFNEKQIRRKRSKPFRFEECSFGREECQKIIQQEWAMPSTGNALQQIGCKTKALGDKLRVWHHTDFNQQKTEIRVLQEKLNDLMRQPHSLPLYEEQRKLHIRYSQLFSLQEKYWKQRSRALWLKEGDRNTAYFQRKAKQVSPEAIAEVVTATPCRVTQDMNEALLASYTNEEIKKALFQMHLSKSPGPDGMSPLFYQKYWDIVSEDNPKEAMHFRPIALCNVICRISSKVVANRLKCWLPKIVSPLQSAYVPGRLISDNTLVATDFMHKLKYQEAGFFFLKLDISKAYDRLDWSFIHAMLTKLGFASRWIQIVMKCVSSMAYSILLHGEPSPLITPTRGIRQGDPLSPYLFILCSEGLSALISQAVHQHNIQGLTMCPQAPTLHHLFFADDSILFGSATTTECMQYRRILNTYERASGQKVNFQKSSVVFSNNVSEEQQQELAAILEVQCVKEHDKYLGLPMRIGRSKSAIFAYIKERLTKKMGDIDDKKKIHWRSWEKLCLTKAEGGIGFKNMYAYNLAMLSKQGWRLISNPHSLIAKLYKAKPVLKAGVQWSIGKGTQVSIWKDRWIPNCPQYLVHKPPDCIFEQVSDLIDPHTRQWILEAIHAIFPLVVAQQVLCIPLSRRTIEDKLVWSPEKKGFYSVKTAYWIARTKVLEKVLASTSQGDPFQELWNRIWKAKVQGKVQICIWRACSNLLPTRAKLSTKGYVGDIHCLLCSQAYEDTAHIFCKCPTAVQILTAAPFHFGRSLLPNINFKEWMLDHALNLKQDVFAQLQMVLWALWKNRNNMLWQNTAQSAVELTISSLAWLEEYNQAHKVEQSSQQQRKRTWQPATQNRWKLNVDGSFLPQFFHGGTGGILRDNAGRFKAAFAVPVSSVTSAKQAELYAIREGLRLIHRLQIDDVVIEIDCMNAVEEIADTQFTHASNEGLLDDIRQDLLALSKVVVQHTPRICNRIAHRLAATAYDANMAWYWLDHPPDFILDMINYDCKNMG
ncbi:uncharacterized protein LOC133744867 [Rosa rugosa]|uniref:uncharacterized protein LOC133744867 n=1 Tax=Rosa rugosa TaxID=74645 RepID=UPI002B403663|nr:uncharacterized protein LOC133744867 [Rosa rugosa]